MKAFYNFEGKPKRESAKRTISTSGELVLLQMVSEQTSGGVLAKTLGPQEEWIVRSHIGWRGK